jgi:error-prone DNA polymerase
MPATYAELHCLSNFTFLRGASHAEELMQRALRLGYSALAITDECSLAGIVRAHVAAKEHGIKLIVGAEFQLDDGLRFVLLAQNREGYANLSELITHGRRHAPKGEYCLSREDLGTGLDFCLALWLPPAAPRIEDAHWLAEHFPGRAWIAVELLARGGDWDRLETLRDLAAQTGLPCVACGDVHMHARSRRALQDTLTAIRLGVPVSGAGYALHPSGERHLRRRETLERIYPRPLLDETLHIAGLCDFSLEELRYEYPEEIVPAGSTPAQHLRQLTEAGLKNRYPGAIPDSVHNQADEELGLIAELRYEPFFLTVHDIVKYARAQNILCQGRGSAANSVVCYALGITEVDPAHTRLLFGRFLSKERNEPPDIDVDFEHSRREEVIQYIYRKYGRDRAALAATVVSYRTRSAFRDVGKALGLDAAQLDRISGSFAWWDRSEERAQRLREAGFDPEAPVIGKLIALTNSLIGFPRHLSQHVGGFVISRGPLSRLVPTENAAMPGDPSRYSDEGVAHFNIEAGSGDPLRTNIQWDKDDLEALGLLKVDVLALGMLSAIRLALEMVNRRRASTLSMADILATESSEEGKPVYDMLCKADSIGVFQVESRAQMSMLPRLRPRCFYDLVIEVAIVRPGPIQGGMVHPYLNNRKKKPDSIEYPSPELEKVLKRTLGIPIFQEQVMEISMVAAGFSSGKADQLRRAMAAWKRKGGLEPFKEDLVNGMLERGYDKTFALRIFEQIKGFGEYGFPESHSASFALLVYVSAWLKCYEPAAFTCALLNSQPMGFYAPAQLVQDARRHGVEVLPVDVLESAWECTIEPRSGSGTRDGGRGTRKNQKSHDLTGFLLTPRPSPLAPDGQPAIRLGLRMISGLSQNAAERLVATRTQWMASARTLSLAPDFSSFSPPASRLTPYPPLAFETLALHAQLTRHDLRCLAEAGALESVAGHRRNAAWTVAGIETRPPVLEAATINEPDAILPAPTEGQDIVADYASLGLSLGRHPLALLRPRFTKMNMTTAQALTQVQNGKSVRVAGLVTGRQRPGTASGVIFVTLEDETGQINVVVWRDISEQQRRPLLAARLLGVQGRLEREGEVTHLIATRLIDYSTLLGELLTQSRDFH